MGESTAALFGVVLGAALTYLLQLRADKLRWARTARKELYATAAWRMQLLEEAARSYKASLETELLLLREGGSAGNQQTEERIKRLRGSEADRRARIRQDVRDTAKELQRLRAEFEMIAPWNIWMTFGLYVTHAVAEGPYLRDEQEDPAEALERMTHTLGRLREEREHFIAAATADIGLPKQRPKWRTALTRVRLFAQKAKDRLSLFGQS